MLEKFQEYIRIKSLCSTNARILVTVSGGIDSVVMLDLFIAAGFDTGIAHCNFHLRGKESDEDANFVESLAAHYKVPFHQQDFDTEQVARDKKISIQMAARNLRYSWFEEICMSEHYDLIATAHNQDDVLETFFINLSRGTGIRGLTGIPVKNGKIIRPMLFSPRETILRYAEIRGIRYREDSSNASEKYLRNKIRHKLLPLFEEQNPTFRKSLTDTILKLSETEKIFTEEMTKLKRNLLEYREGKIFIRIEDLEKLESKKTILYEILTEFNFGSAAMEDIIDSLQGLSGKQFFSPTHRLIKDRKELIITPLKEVEDKKYYLEEGLGQIHDPIDLEWVLLDRPEKFQIPKDPNIACLNMDLLDFPLMLRHWQKGDYFQPFGMKGMKKISDFLIDEKVSLPDKEKIWLLASGQKILWVVGYRIDERFRIGSGTSQVLMIKYFPAGSSGSDGDKHPDTRLD